jgi:hypothetical protein
MAIWVSHAHSAPTCPAQLRSFSASAQATRAGSAPRSLRPASFPQQSQSSRTPRAGRLIHWPAVGIAAGVVWLLVAGLVWLLYQDGHAAMAAVAGEQAVQLAQATPPPETTDSPAVTEPSTQPGADEAAPFVSVPLSPALLLSPAESMKAAHQLPASEQGSGRENVACETYGTQVSFLSNPADAARRAAKERKLLFVLHLSGNFEDARFT